MFIYRWIAILKGIRRRFLIDRAIYKSYGAGDKVGGWHGWYELNDECIAFRGTDGHISFIW